MVADHVWFAEAYLAVAAFACQLTLLAMQLRTYRKTKHLSLLILAISSTLAILYLVAGVAAALHAPRTTTLWWSYLAVEIVLVSTQVVLGIWGAAWLFKAFADRCTGIEPDISRPGAPIIAMAGRGDDLRTDASATTFEMDIRGTLVRLSRLWALRRVDNVASLATERSVALLALISLALWTSLDRLRAGPGASFNAYGIPDLGLMVLMLLALAFVLARRSHPPLPHRQSLFIIAAALPVLIVWDHFTDRWAPTATIALVLYALVYVWRALRAFSGATQPRAIAFSAVLLCGFVWLGGEVYLEPSLWMPKEIGPAADSTLRADVSESLMFDQQHRLDKALNSVSASDGSAPEVFFVGFAGVGSQKVFAEEIKFASRVVAQRYDTAHRELLLINDRRDRETYPLATVSGLRYALKGIARKMNLQRDILFLSLSSHGSDEPELSVSNGVLNLEQVTGKNLMRALRDSGIRWRIIVISACHAGAFIPLLEDPSTIIITAAASDRTSFGCSNDRDLTYFGEAFYRDALPGARSLEQAFSLARAAIAKREAAEHITPSKPQAYFGADLEPVLHQHPMKQPVAAQSSPLPR
ncbi:MAG: C13 family peptidase [Steroidobacteraceae bacterium]